MVALLKFTSWKKLRKGPVIAKEIQKHDKNFEENEY